ncbi:sensor histidine kinase [Embleya hyalina]|uniref:sensor histidine kinase n=1 Tax=Embleya hyalina TaxID=516124 RepID=UPI00135ABE31|nr:sensor histidine kinase [Embleya hyalina]
MDRERAVNTATAVARDAEEVAFGTKLLTVYRGAYLLLAAITAAEFAGRDAPLWCYAALLVMPVSFWVMVPPGIDPTEWDRRGRAHLVLAYAAVTALSLQDPEGIVLMYVLMPLTFTFVEATIPSMLLSAYIFGMNGALRAREAHWEHGVVASILVEIAVVLGFSFLMARLVQWLADRVEERGRLLRELEATRAELAETHHQAGVRVERERMAREIHDTLAQGFTSILMLLQAAGITVDSDSEATRKRLDLAERVARDNLAEARALVAAQGPAEGAEPAEPLAELLGRTVAGLGEELEVAASFEVVGSEYELSSTVQVVLVRVLQESLANIRKHAGATSVAVELAYRPFATRLTVVDDGRGFEPGSGKGGYGLPGMRARLAQVGGEVEVVSAPGRGTTVRVEVPQ